MSLWRRYRPAFTAGAIVASFVVLLSVVAVVVPNPHAADAKPDVKPVRSLLLQIRDEDKRGVGALIVTALPGSPARASLTLVPADLSLTLADGSQIDLADVTVPPYPQQAVEGLRTTAGVGIDGELVLERLGFAGIVDYVGGLNVKVDAPFATTTTDLQSVTIRPGVRHLRGIDALAYIGEGNLAFTVEQRAQHLRQVIEKLLQRLPTDTFRVNQVLVSAGLGARSSVPTDGLSELLAVASRSARRHTVVWNELPVTRQRLGASQVALIDQERISAFIGEHALPTSTPFGDMPSARVLVRDGTGVPDSAFGVREALAKLDSVAAVADTWRPAYATTSPAARTRFIARDPASDSIAAMAEVLGVKPTPARAGQLPAGVDALVVVGVDLLAALRQGL